MRIRQVIVTVFEESSFIKRAIHLPAVKNKTGTLIYCRLAETWSFSSLYENQGVCLNKPRGKYSALCSALKSTTETERYGLPLHYCDVFCMWHVVLAEITKCFSPLQRSIKSFPFIPRGSGIQTAPGRADGDRDGGICCRGTAIPAVRDTAAVVV